MCYNIFANKAKNSKRRNKMEVLATVLEILMIGSFGASWPFNVMKSYKARTTKGKSLLFLVLIFSGYIAGIASKIISFSIKAPSWIGWVAFSFYILNLLMVGTDLLLYVRNKKLDAEREKEAA